METKELQSQIKSMINRLKWSQRRLAREIYIETHDYDDDLELDRFQESLKKDLSRSTTKPERLMEYIKIISRHDDFKKVDMVIPVYISTDILSSSIEAGMRNISQKINKLINDESDL